MDLEFGQPLTLVLRLFELAQAIEPVLLIRGNQIQSKRPVSTIDYEKSDRSGPKFRGHLHVFIMAAVSADIVAKPDTSIRVSGTAVTDIHPPTKLLCHPSVKRKLYIR